MTNLLHENVSEMHLPEINKSWSIGSLISATASIVALISVLIGLVWGYAGVTYATKSIPALEIQQQINTRDIAVIKANQANSDVRFAEIQRQYELISEKLDRLSERQHAEFEKR